MAINGDKSIVVPLVVDGFVVLLGAYQLGKINTTLENLGKKIEPISEAKLAVLQQQVAINERRVDLLEAILRDNGLTLGPPRRDKR